MMVVGLTGGIASGKSSVAAMFRAEGIPVICADTLAREIVAPGSPGLRAIRETFGPTVISQEGELERKALADVVFGSSEARRTLESITHPRVAALMRKAISYEQAQGASIVVADIPLLFEVGWVERFDVTVLVYTPENVQLERLTARDGLSRTEAEARIRSQMPIETKKRLATVVIDNSGPTERTRDRVRKLIAELPLLALKNKRDYRGPG